MAAPQAKSPFQVSSDIAKQKPETPRETPAQLARAEIARLAALHEEARETALLANILGHAPAAAISLSAAILATVALTHGAPLAPMLAWITLVGIGLGALVRAYGQAIRAPFERAPLRAFHEDLKAILLYAGFAWGAGAYLALPVSSVALLIAFSVGACATVAATLRTRLASLYFVAPVATLSAFAAVLRPFESGALGAALVLVGCALVVAGLYATERRWGASSSTPRMADLPLA
ncbi:MAG: hypothetical protein HY243_03300 [Proteobacteria bacterium]|nr:hypothetical protein [Pseudomonadota bacterium]